MSSSSISLPLGANDEEETVVSWDDHDAGNPCNWSGRKKAAVLLTTMMLIVNSTMGSALPSNALPFIASEWQVASPQQRVLPISIYLVGYVMGPIFWAPLSEQFGRKTPTLCAFTLFTLSTLGSALAPTWASFLVFRLAAGVFASAPLAIVPGIIADLCSNPGTRGRIMGLFLVTTVSGPLLAPIISGFCAPTIGWRWAFWIGLIYAGVTLPALALLPETCGPVLLARRCPAPAPGRPRPLAELAAVVLARPLRMMAGELLVSASCAYMALCYGVFYMCFEAYPVVFEGVYGLSPGQCGLAYLAVGVGCLLALPGFWAYEVVLARARARGAPWTRCEEARRLPLACVGGPLFAVALFWMGWTARPDVHFMVPALAGVPFGLGFMCIFQALLNYLTDAYAPFAASANAAASASRSLLATVLPLATVPMFQRLGISGALSLLGGLSTLMCAVPFLFLVHGKRIRANSKFCVALREREEEQQQKQQQQQTRQQWKKKGAGKPTLGQGRRMSDCEMTAGLVGGEAEDMGHGRAASAASACSAISAATSAWGAPGVTVSHDEGGRSL
ncbi:MFS general substrate transporter [Trichocladium antarcticum]|uniref:MFS general substrate transporter n=1 Tax=Trichocladium antarcticum TaxID=1450529 RepID=A0AAN6ZCS1_9PEZI|nr:MFS general substrate transporter [Trichocladium antarcticum]